MADEWIISDTADRDYLHVATSSQLRLRRFSRDRSVAQHANSLRLRVNSRSISFSGARATPLVERGTVHACGRPQSFFSTPAKVVPIRRLTAETRRTVRIGIPRPLNAITRRSCIETTAERTMKPAVDHFCLSALAPCPRLITGLLPVDAQTAQQRKSPIHHNGQRGYQIQQRSRGTRREMAVFIQTIAILVRFLTAAQLVLGVRCRRQATIF